MADQATSRRTFGPVVLLGVAASALASVAGSKPWVSGRSGGFDTAAEDNQAMVSTLSASGASESPLAAALALVLQACWGVLLVTRGRFRRAVAVLALVTAVGLVVTTVEAFWTLPDKLTDTLLEMSGTDTVSTSLTPWYAAALVAAVLAVVAAAAAVRLVPRWPEMGTRYDAPTGAAVDRPLLSGETADEVGRDDAPTENIDIWKALDEGRDPTA